MNLGTLGSTCVAAFAGTWLVASAAVAAPEVGTAVAVRNKVTIQAAEQSQPLRKGEVLHQDEVLATGKASSVEIELLDKTKLAVGADSTIVLDKLVFDASAPTRTVTLNMSKGAFRFITGLSPKESYEIKTPTATMGVRGTVFDVFVSAEGETAILLHEGAVDVCATPATCQRHDKVGRLVHVSLARVLTAPLRWDGSLFKGLAFAGAFPFVGKRLVIDPVRRVGDTALFAGRQVGRVLTTPGRVIQRTLRSPL